MKFIFDLAEQPETAALHKEILDNDERVNQRVKFLEKQAEDLAAEANKTNREIWGKIENFLATNGKFPPEYSKSQHTLMLHKKGTQIFMDENKEENSLKELISALLRK